MGEGDRQMCFQMNRQGLPWKKRKKTTPWLRGWAPKRPVGKADHMRGAFRCAGTAISTYVHSLLLPS